MVSIDRNGLAPKGTESFVSIDTRNGLAPIGNRVISGNHAYELLFNEVLNYCPFISTWLFISYILQWCPLRAVRYQLAVDPRLHSSCTVLVTVIAAQYTYNKYHNSSIDNYIRDLQHYEPRSPGHVIQGCHSRYIPRCRLQCEICILVSIFTLFDHIYQKGATKHSDI